MDKDSLLTGFVLGAIIPVIGYMAVEGIFDLLTHFHLMDHTSGGAIGRRGRTIALFAICCNLIPFNYARRNYLDFTMRGIVFPTLFYVGLWLYKFSHIVF